MKKSWILHLVSISIVLLLLVYVSSLEFSKGDVNSNLGQTVLRVRLPNFFLRVPGMHYYWVTNLTQKYILVFNLKKDSKLSSFFLFFLLLHRNVFFF